MSENLQPNDEPFEHNLIQTYLNTPGRMISTMYRQSSAALNPSWYYETIIWEWDRSTKARGEMLHTEDSGGNAVTAHHRHATLVRRAWRGEPFETPTEEQDW